MKRLLILCCFFQPLLAEKIYFPQVVASPEWTTTFTFINLTDQKRKILLNFVNKDGEPWFPLNLWFELSGGMAAVDPNGRKEITIQPWAITRWSTSPQENGALRFGYMFLDDNPEYLKASAFLTYNPSPERKTEVGVFPARPTDDLIFPMEADSAIAIVNTVDHEIRFWIDYLWTTPVGSVSESNSRRSFTIPANGHRSFFLATPNPYSYTDGWVRIYTESALAVDPIPNARVSVMSLIFRPDGTMSSLPPHDIPAAWREAGD